MIFSKVAGGENRVNEIDRIDSHVEQLEPRLLWSGGAQVVAYLPDYEFDATINHIDWSTLVQVNYFSMVPDAKTGRLPGTTASLPAESSSGYDLSQLETASALAHEHGVKIDIVIGGGGLDGTIATVAGKSKLRNAFADSVKALCKTYQLDGVDLDWEPENPTAQQLGNYARLIHALKVRAPGLDRSAAVNAEMLPIAGSGDSSRYVLTPAAMRDLTSINVMAYDLDFADHSPFDRATQDLTAWGNYATANGLATRKLLLGLPFYGRAGTSWDDTRDEPYADLVAAAVAQTGQIPAANVDTVNVSFPDAFAGASANWFYNGPQTIADKTRFSINNSFGGVMIWELGLDHFNASGQYDSQSLLPAVQQTILTETATLSGQVFADRNGDARKDDSEAGLAGFTVFVDLNFNNVQDREDPAASTDSSGAFSFNRLTAGDYLVRIVRKRGYTQTTPAKKAGVPVSLASGQAFTGISFGERH